MLGLQAPDLLDERLRSRGLELQRSVQLVAELDVVSLGDGQHALDDVGGKVLQADDRKPTACRALDLWDRVLDELVIGEVAVPEHEGVGVTPVTGRRQTVALHRATERCHEFGRDVREAAVVHRADDLGAAAEPRGVDHQVLKRPHVGNKFCGETVKGDAQAQRCWGGAFVGHAGVSEPVVK